MSIQAQTAVRFIFTEDLLYSQQHDSAISTSSPARIISTTLASGYTTFVLPAGTTGFGIVPPVSNTTAAIVLKGSSTTDTGIPLNLSNPSLISILATTSTTQVVVTTSTTLVGVILYIL